MMNDIREVTRENKKTDKNIVQVNVELFNIKSKVDPTVMSQLKSINDTRFVFIQDFGIGIVVFMLCTLWCTRHK